MKLVNTGLLLLTESTSFGRLAIDNLLKLASLTIGQTLYVAVDDSALEWLLIDDHYRHRRSVFDLTATIYSTAALICRHLDVRFLIDNVKSVADLAEIVDKKPIDRVFVDFSGHHLNFFEHFSPVVLPKFDRSVGDDDPLVTIFEFDCNDGGAKVGAYGGSILGGTFDRLHNGHKILLSCAALLAREQFTCGVTKGDILNKSNKILPELIEPVEKRISSVADFVSDISPSLNLNIVPIDEPYGPSIVDRNVHCIVVSKETVKGAVKVNERRKENNLPNLDVFIINLVEDDVGKSENRDAKVSSSKIRKSLLGCVFKEPTKNELIPDCWPRIIGLCGGIASGKSQICKYLSNLGGHVIDCDRLAHQVYQPNTEAYNEIVATFGMDVIDEKSDGQINRAILGKKVFDDKNEMIKLNAIVWPKIADLVRIKIGECTKRVAILDAAVLLEAGWEDFVHEIWVTIVPKEEAIRRIVDRDGIGENQARLRIDSQLGNNERVRQANVVFCSLWDYQFTKTQVEKAWQGLVARIDGKQ